MKKIFVLLLLLSACGGNVEEPVTQETVVLDKDLSLLEENKEYTKDEAEELKALLGCTTLRDLGETYFPCSSLQEFNSRKAQLLLEQELDREQLLLEQELDRESRQRNLSYALYALTFIVVALLLRYIFKQAQRHETLTLNGDKYLMPGSWVESINELGNTVNSNSEKSLQSLSTSQDLMVEYESLKATFLELQNKLNKQDQEIDRLKKGYDNYLIKKHLTRFIRVYMRIKDELNNNVNDSILGDLEALMNDALDSSNVKEHIPPIGSDYREAQGVADPPEIIYTENEDDNFKIFEIVKPGYYIEYENSKEYIQDAVVKVYSVKQKMEKE